MRSLNKTLSMLIKLLYWNAIFCMFFRWFPENPSVRVFFRIFVSIFFPHETSLKSNFNEKIEKFCRKSKYLRRFFRFSRGFFIVFSYFFLDFRLEFFNEQTAQKRNFSKKIEKNWIKSKILRWFLGFSIFVSGTVS